MPKLLGDAAVAGICLIRLEQMGPRRSPLPWGLQSENAAHRMAVCWMDKGGRVPKAFTSPSPPCSCGTFPIAGRASQTCFIRTQREPRPGHGTNNS
jgi:hypothetical protein